MGKSALIIVDVQNDFCEGGSLAVPKGQEVAQVFNELRKKRKWDLIVLTQDFHPKNHTSFASNHPGEALFSVIQLEDGTDQVMWPDHCVQGTPGADFRSDLVKEESDVIVQKGKNWKVDSYSGFFDNNKLEKTELDDVLKKHGITEVYVGGLAYDFCVQYTARDAASLNYKTFLVEDACRGISDDGIKAAKAEMEKVGITIIQSAEVK